MCFGCGTQGKIDSGAGADSEGSNAMYEKGRVESMRQVGVRGAVRLRPHPC